MAIGYYTKIAVAQALGTAAMAELRAKYGIEENDDAFIAIYGKETK